jgi:dTDP-4-dehydrorhamnose reductase
MFLIVGGDSEIGAATFRAMTAEGLPVASTTRRQERVGPNRPYLDMLAPIDGWNPPPQTLGACICAAAARIATCAAEPQATARLNVDQTLILIDNLIGRGIYVLFLSTNQVFDGNTPLVPAHAPHSPVSEYGRQKARVEAALRGLMERGAPVAILRLAKVAPANMPPIDGWIAELSAGHLVCAFGDMTLAPAPIALVCSSIIALMKDRGQGIFQFTGPRDARYVDVARFIADQVGVSQAQVTETSARDAGLPVGSTPHYTTLDSTELHRRYGIEAPDVWQVVASMIASTAPSGNGNKVLAS